MNKICIIGDSHIGALKLAYRDEKRSGIDFYASGRAGFRFLYIKDKKLLTEDIETKNDIRLTNGADFIPLNKYNNVLIYGCGILSMGKGDNWLDYYSSAISKMYSENCLRQAYIDRLKIVYGFKLAKMIKKSNICEDVAIIPSPFPNEAHPLVDDKLLSSSTPALAKKILDKVELVYKNYLSEYGIILLWNPPELLAKNGFTTDIKYKHSREEDITHINVLGGKIILDNICSYLGL